MRTEKAGAAGDEDTFALLIISHEGAPLPGR